MGSTQSALRAPSKLIDGRMAVCNLACEGLSEVSATPDSAQRKLYIGGLSPDVTTEMLLTYFGRYGEIEEGSVAYEKDTNESRGFGFVTFKIKTVKASKKAIDDPHKILGGRFIIVKLADTHKGKLAQTQLPAAVVPLPSPLSTGYLQPGKPQANAHPVGYSYPQNLPSFLPPPYISPPAVPTPYHPTQPPISYPPIPLKKEPFGRIGYHPITPVGMKGFQYYICKQ